MTTSWHLNYTPCHEFVIGWGGGGLNLGGFSQEIIKNHVASQSKKYRFLMIQPRSNSVPAFKGRCRLRNFPISAIGIFVCWAVCLVIIECRERVEVSNWLYGGTLVRDVTISLHSQANWKQYRRQSNRFLAKFESDHHHHHYHLTHLWCERRNNNTNDDWKKMSWANKSRSLSFTPWHSLTNVHSNASSCVVRRNGGRCTSIAEEFACGIWANHVPPTQKELKEGIFLRKILCTITATDIMICQLKDQRNLVAFEFRRNWFELDCWKPSMNIMLSNMFRGH